MSDAAMCPYRGEVERLRAVIAQAVADLEHAGGNYRTLWIGLAVNGLRDALPAKDRTPGGDTAASTIGAETSGPRPRQRAEDHATPEHPGGSE